MADGSLRPSWPLLVVVSIVTAGAGFGIGRAIPNGHVEQSEVSLPTPLERFAKATLKWDRDDRQALDAAKRWAEKSGETVEDIQRNRFPVGVSTGTRDCVQLMLDVGSVGGNPAYCYRAGTLELVEEHSDVE